MRHLIAGAIVGLGFFTALGVALALMSLLIGLVGRDVVALLVVMSTAFGLGAAVADYYTERR